MTSQLKVHYYNKGYKDINVVTGGRANFSRDSQEIKVNLLYKNP